jgi:hypothetical protein
MRRIIMVIFMLGTATALPLPVVADGFNVSEPMLCAVLDARECNAEVRECTSGGAEMINLPHFLRIDLKSKTISSQKGETQRVTPIDSTQDLNGNLILRGVQNDKTWQIVISGQIGRMALTAGTPTASYVVFGACINP